MPQIHGEADGAEVTIEGHVAAEFTEHAHDGRSDDGWRRWTGRRPFHGWPRCRRCGRVSGRGGDQEAIDGEQAARELRLETLFFLAKKGLRNSSRRKKLSDRRLFCTTISPPFLLLWRRKRKEERKKKLVLLSEI